MDYGRPKKISTFAKYFKRAVGILVVVQVIGTIGGVYYYDKYKNNPGKSNSWFINQVKVDND